jgi:hypothetical protein
LRRWKCQIGAQPEFATLIVSLWALDGLSWFPR